MDQDKWEALKEELKRKFSVEEERLEDLTVETQDGLVKQGTAEVIIFETPLGRIKLVRESRPVVLGKKEFYSHRAGQAARVEYEFSETDFSYKIKAYKWNDDLEEWSEIDVSSFGR